MNVRPPVQLVVAALRMRRARELVTAAAKERELQATRLEQTRLLSYPDPADFARDVLGLRLWRRQIELMRAVATHPKVAVRAGRKVSKSNSLAALALWWIKTKDRSKVIMTAPTNNQVRGIFWQELTQLYRNARSPIGGVLHKVPNAGLQFDDGRQIVGFATKTAENSAGWSGVNVLYILDEASGIPPEIFEAIRGNRAGGASIVMCGNPTRPAGVFYDAFHTLRHEWFPLHISSEETPNITGDGDPIEGLATPGWMEEMRLACGPDYKLHPVYQVHVLGEFASRSEDTVIGLILVEEAMLRWPDASPDGVLDVGVDVAMFGDDDSVIQPVRGKRALKSTVVRSMDPVDVAGQVRQVIFGKGGDDGGLVRRARTGHVLEKPRVKVDIIGVGAGVWAELRRVDGLEVYGINVAESPTNKPSDGQPEFFQLRDQLWFGVRDWLKAGGALMSDPMLEGELVAVRYGFHGHMQIKVEAKDKMKKRLGRSPDRADALALAIYTPPPKPKATVQKINWRRR